MINLEQVKLLETKVTRAVDYVERLAKENTALRRQETELQTRLGSYQKRIDELEVLVMGFKEDQSRIEEGILSALDKLSQFEKAIEKSLKDTKSATKEPGARSAKPQQAAPQQAAAETAAAETAASASTGDGSGNGQTCFEIPETSAEALPDSADSPPQGGDDISDPLENTANATAEGGELDIF